MGGEQEERDEGEDEKKRSNLLWLSWTDRRFASDSRCVRKERKGKKNTKKKKHSAAQFVANVFRCIQSQEIKTYGLFAFPWWCLHSGVVCPTLIIHRVCLN